MRFCLGFQFLNEASWLRRHLPVILRASAIDGIVAVDGGSTDDSADVVREVVDQTEQTMIMGGSANGDEWHQIELGIRPSLPLVIERHDWQWDFAAQQNTVIELAERHGYDAYLKWDPDELLWPQHIDQAAALLATGEHKAVIVSRYNFEGDRRHYCPYLYPDKQLRFVMLNQGFRWDLPLHATTNAYQLWSEPGGTSPGLERGIVWLPHVNIYHYEGTKPIEERELKWENYRRVGRGEPPLTALPDGHLVPSLPVRFTVEFCGEEPH